MQPLVQGRRRTRVPSGLEIVLIAVFATSGNLAHSTNKPAAPAPAARPAQQQPRAVTPQRPATAVRAPNTGPNAVRQGAVNGRPVTANGFSRPAGTGTVSHAGTGTTTVRPNRLGGNTTQRGTGTVPHGPVSGGNTQAGAGHGASTVHAGASSNEARAGSGGVGGHSISGAASAAHTPARPAISHIPGGGTRATFANGATVSRSAAGRPTEYRNPKSGVQGTFDRNGRLSSVTRTGPDGSRMNIRRGPGNERRIDTIRTGRGGVEHVVSYGHDRGYYERPIAGRPGYVQRTVIVGGRSYGVVYHHYFFHGVFLNSPVPAIVFAPAYYGWLMTPWVAPVYYTPAVWGWAGQPWYGYYGPVFTPYPAYLGPDQWLTDYVISANLQQAYDNQQAALVAQTAPPPPPPITDEEKALMDQDIKLELARQQQAVINNSYDANSPQAPKELPEALQDHLFTVFAAPVEARLASGGTCDLAEGDMLFRKGDAPNSDNTVDVVVKSSHADAGHPGFCSQQAAARVQLTDLQEMYNHKKELLSEGMEKQASLEGKKHGMPKGPKPQPTEVASGQAAPDEDAVAELKKQILAGDESENEVKTAANAGS